MTSTSTDSPADVRRLTTRERLSACIDRHMSRRYVHVTLARALRDLDAATERARTAEARADARVRLAQREAEALRVEVRGLRSRLRVAAETLVGVAREIGGDS